MKRPRLRAYLGFGLLAAGLCGPALSGDLILHIERFVAFYGLSLAGFALLATAAATLPLRGALVAAVVLRVIFLPGTPSLTDDFYRYQWDGRVQQAGVLLGLAGAVCITRSLRGRARTAPAFAWTLTLLVACLPVVHAWYWLAPLALGLAAGIWLPVVIGLVAPFPEAVSYT